MRETRDSLYSAIVAACNTFYDFYEIWPEMIGVNYLNRSLIERGAHRMNWIRMQRPSLTEPIKWYTEDIDIDPMITLNSASIPIEAHKSAAGSSFVLHHEKTGILKPTDLVMNAATIIRMIGIKGYDVFAYPDSCHSTLELISIRKDDMYLKWCYSRSLYEQGLYLIKAEIDMQLSKFKHVETQNNNNKRGDEMALYPLKGKSAKLVIEGNDTIYTIHLEDCELTQNYTIESDVVITSVSGKTKRAIETREQRPTKPTTITIGGKIYEGVLTEVTEETKKTGEKIQITLDKEARVAKLNSLMDEYRNFNYYGKFF